MIQSDSTPPPPPQPFYTHLSLKLCRSYLWKHLPPPPPTIPPPQSYTHISLKLFTVVFLETSSSLTPSYIHLSLKLSRSCWWRPRAPSPPITYTCLWNCPGRVGGDLELPHPQLHTPVSEIVQVVLVETSSSLTPSYIHLSLKLSRSCWWRPRAPSPPITYTCLWNCPGRVGGDLELPRPWLHTPVSETVQVVFVETSDSSKQVNVVVHGQTVPQRVVLGAVADLTVPLGRHAEVHSLAVHVNLRGLKYMYRCRPQASQYLFLKLSSLGWTWLQRKLSSVYYCLVWTVVPQASLLSPVSSDTLTHLLSLGDQSTLTHRKGHTHTHTHTRTHARTHARMHARTHARTHTHTHAGTQARTHAGKRTHTHTHKHTLPLKGAECYGLSETRGLPTDPSDAGTQSFTHCSNRGGTQSQPLLTAPTEAGHSPILYRSSRHSPILISPFLQRRDTVTFFIHSSRWGRTQSHPLLIAPAAAGHSPILYLPLQLRRDTVPAWRWSLWIFRPQEAPADPARVPWERWRCCCWLLPAAACPEWRPCVAPPPPARARRPSNSHKPQTAISTTFSHQHNHTQATDCRTVSTTFSHQHNHTQATDCRTVSTTFSHQHNHRAPACTTTVNDLLKRTVITTWL